VTVRRHTLDSTCPSDPHAVVLIEATPRCMAPTVHDACTVRKVGQWRGDANRLGMSANDVTSLIRDNLRKLLT